MKNNLKIAFDPSETQRNMTSWEFHHLTIIGVSPLAISIYVHLVRLRDPEKKAFISKKKLMERVMVGNQQTLDKGLNELQKKNFLVIRSFESLRGGLKRKNWFYYFPFFDQKKVFHNLAEKEENRPKRSSKTETPISLKDQDINKNNRKTKSFPQPDPIPTPKAIGTKKGTAVFSSEQKVEESFPQPEHLISETSKLEQRNKGIEIPVFSVFKGLAKNEQENEFKRKLAEFEKICPWNRKKSLERDLKGLVGKFGIKSVLTGMMCGLESGVTLLNPGGWIRAHLNNPGWMERAVEMLEARAQEAKQVSLAKEKDRLKLVQARVEREHAQMDALKVEEFIQQLSPEGLEKLESEAKKAVENMDMRFKPNGFVRFQMRILAKSLMP